MGQLARSWIGWFGIGLICFILVMFVFLNLLEQSETSIMDKTAELDDEWVDGWMDVLWNQFIGCFGLVTVVLI